jgi:hypothetical protein
MIHGVSADSIAWFGDPAVRIFMSGTTMVALLLSLFSSLFPTILGLLFSGLIGTAVPGTVPV